MHHKRHVDSTVSAIASAVRGVLSRPDPILFAGAGVAQRVGLPSWPEYLNHLAKACDDFNDPASGTLIRQRVGTLNYLGAASVFKTCDRIPDGERLKRLSEPFLREIPEHYLTRLEPLVCLPFTAIVTTNYDNSLHKVRARYRGYSNPVERGDGSLRGAQIQREFFIARVHGRAELPITMVVDAHDYKEVSQDSEYLDFLLHILKARTCLFMGFSFDDPAVDHVMSLYENRCGPHFSALHVALIPHGSERLAARLRAVNIQTILYDDSSAHATLWRAMRIAFESDRAVDPGARRSLAISAQLTSVHKYMAFAYAALQSSTMHEPVVASIRDAIVLTTIAQSDVGVTEDEVIASVKEILALTPAEASSIVSQSIGRLVPSEQILKKGSRLRVLTRPSSDLESDLSKLASGVMARMRVRDGIKPSHMAKAIVKRVLEGVFLARAWDVAAHFAGAGAGVSTDIAQIIGDLLSKEDSASKRLTSASAAKLAIVDLLTVPEDSETEALTRIGRAAFGLQLVLSSPRQTLFRKYSLPQHIYLDANVVMPAITKGHPLRPIYVDCLRRLEQANKDVGQGLVVGVGEQFLNEIISHRRLALEIVGQLGFEEPEKLTRHILFYDATNTNVFIGAFASFVGRQAKRLSFTEFLTEVAPYDDEDSLGEYLKAYGMVPLPMTFFGEYNAEFNDIFGMLREGYSAVHRPWARPKASVLMEHEAAQLTRLLADQKEGIRSVFVTADGELRRILQRDTRLHFLAGGTMSHLGLVALVDVMVGLDGDSRSLARLVWAASQREPQQVVFDYFIRLGLRRYREGMAMEMQEAARAVAASAAEEIARDDLQLFGNEVDDIARTARFIDRYESDFFDSWKREIDRKEKLEGEED